MGLCASDLAGMRLQTYRVRTIEEGVRAMRQELGPHAILLSSRPVRVAGFRGWLGATLLEITAAVDHDKVPVKEPDTKTDFRAALQSAAEGSSTKGALADQIQMGAVYELARTTQADVRALRLSIKTAGHLGDPWGDLPPVWADRARYLQRVGMRTETIQGLVDWILDHYPETVSPAQVENIWSVAVQQIIRTQVPDTAGGQVLMLVGPTGDGKTTTVGKLAGMYSQTHGRKIGVISTDSYRVGARAQIQAYAERLTLPFRSAKSGADVASAIDVYRRAGMELIVIDTAGCSPRDQALLAHLRSLLPSPVAVQMQLVVSAKTSLGDLGATIQQFQPFPLHSLIVTKLDDTTNKGAVVELLHRAKLPIAYFTTGQVVPDDVEVATPQKIAAYVMGVAC